MLASPFSHGAAFVKRWKPVRIHHSAMPRYQSRLSSSHAATPFTYRLAAASAAKRTSPRTPKLGQDYWNYASSDINSSRPYLQSRKQDSGEDAFFAATVGGSKHDVAFGVVDGVGGWQDQGVDPSNFSQGLCVNMAKAAHIHENKTALRPQSLLQKAFDAVMANPSILAGGSTASLAVMNETGAIETAKCVIQAPYWKKRSFY